MWTLYLFCFLFTELSIIFNPFFPFHKSKPLVLTIIYTLIILMAVIVNVHRVLFNVKGVKK